MLGRHRIARAFEASVPGCARFDLGIVGRVHPCDASAPAEAGDCEFVDVALLRGGRVGDGRIEIRHHLRIGNLGNNFRDDLIHLELRDIALSRVHFGRDGEVAELGEAPADVFDVLVHAEDFLHNKHDRKLLALGGHRAIGRNRTVLGWDSYFTGNQSVSVGGDGFRARGAHGEGEAHGQFLDEEFAAAVRNFRRGEECVVGIHRDVHS